MEKSSSASPPSDSSPPGDTKPPPKRLRGLFKWLVAHIQQSSFVLAVLAIGAVATWTLKARDLVREWTREVIRTDVVDSQDFHQRTTESLIKNAAFVEKIDERAKSKLDQSLAQKEFWDKVSAEAKTVAIESARDEVNQSDANRIAKLSDAMLSNEVFRTVVVTKMMNDLNLRRELTAAIVRDPVALERVRGPQGLQGVQGPQGPQGVQGVPGQPGTKGETGVCTCPPPQPVNPGG